MGGPPWVFPSLGAESLPLSRSNCTCTLQRHVGRRRNVCRTQARVSLRSPPKRPHPTGKGCSGLDARDAFIASWFFSTRLGEQGSSMVSVLWRHLEKLRSKSDGVPQGFRCHLRRKQLRRLCLTRPQSGGSPQASWRHALYLLGGHRRQHGLCPQGTFLLLD